MPGPVNSRPLPDCRVHEPGIELAPMRQRPVADRMPNVWNHVALPTVPGPFGTPNSPLLRLTAELATENARDAVDSAWSAVQPSLAQLRRAGMLDARALHSLESLGSAIRDMAADTSAAFVKAFGRHVLNNVRAQLAAAGPAGRDAVAGLERLVELPESPPGAPTADEILAELVQPPPLAPEEARAFVGAALHWSAGGCVNQHEMREHLCGVERVLSDAKFDQLVQDRELMRKWNVDAPGGITHLVTAECRTPAAIQPTLRAARALPLRTLELTAPACDCVVDLRRFEGTQISVVLHIAPPHFRPGVDDRESRRGEAAASASAAAAVAAARVPQCVVYVPRGVELLVPSVGGVRPNVVVHHANDDID